MLGPRWVCVCIPVVLLASVAAQIVPQSVLSMPVRLELDKATAEVKRGGSVSYTVTLKNFQNQAVAAPRETQVEIVAPGYSHTLTISPGKSSETFEVPASAIGVGKVMVRSGKLGGASSLILVTPPIAALQGLQRESTKGEATVKIQPIVPATPAATPSPTKHKIDIGKIAGVVALPGQPAPPPQASPPASAEPAPPPSTVPALLPRKIQIYVQPDRVSGNALEHKWTASVSVAAEGEDDSLIAVTQDIGVHFTTQMGRLDKADVTIPQGQASTFNSPVALVSDRSGHDQLVAASSYGSAHTEVIYDPPLPARLILSVGTPNFGLNGNSTAQIQVCLQDAGSNLSSYPDRDTQVNLTSALGQFERNLVKILQGQYCSDTTQLTSRNAGDVLIRAKSGIDLAADESKVTFPSFPWHLVLLAAVGGLVGALVASSSGLASGRWWASVWRSLVLGAVLGVAFYLFTFFGAFVLPKYVPLNLQNIPTVSAIGATLLGFVGGLYGRKLWKVDGGDAPPAIKDEKAA